MKLTINYLEEDLSKEQINDFFTHLLGRLECCYSYDGERGEVNIAGEKEDIFKGMELLKEFKNIIKEESIEKCGCGIPIPCPICNPIEYEKYKKKRIDEAKTNPDYPFKEQMRGKE